MEPAADEEPRVRFDDAELLPDGPEAHGPDVLTGGDPALGREEHQRSEHPADHGDGRRSGQVPGEKKSFKNSEIRNF